MDFSLDTADFYKTIQQFNAIKPTVKNDTFGCDFYLCRIMVPNVAPKFYPLHRHSFFELHIPISGKAEYQIGDRQISCSPSKALLLPPNTTHRHIHSEKYVSLTLGFSLVSPAALANWNTGYPDYMEIDCSPDIYNCIFYIFHTLPKDPSEDCYLFNTLLSAILYDILKHIPALKEKLEIPTTVSEETVFEDARIRTAIQYIHDNVALPISVDDVATHLLISSRQLNRILQSARNLSVNQLINQIRIDVAKEHIENTDTSLSKIALLCGFNSPTHFNLTFKKITGITPKQYRQIAKEKAL